MNVLIVSSMNRGSQTGVTAHYNRLLAELPGSVESVVLLTPDDAPKMVRKSLGLTRRLAALFGTTGRLFHLEFDNFVSIWSAVRKYRNGSVDIIHAQDVNAGAAAFLGLDKQVKSLVTCHFNDDPVYEYKLKYKLSDGTESRLRRWYDYLFKQNSAFVTVSDYIKQTSSHWRPEGIPCEVIQNGVSFPERQPKLAADTLTIVNVGTVEERKNQVLLIEAAAALRAKGFTQFNVLLLGDGPKRPEWEALIEAKGLKDQVSFLGFRTDAATYIQRASLYVHTALNESWGYTITEAIALGTPVIALATGGIPEQFNKQKRGLLPKNATADEVADAILQYQDAETRANLAAEQFAYASERFNLGVMIKKHVAFYKIVAGRFKNNYVKTMVEP